MNKLWLCGIIRGNRSVLEKSISESLEYFDGCIFVVDDRVSAKDYEWLLSLENSKIILKTWANDHAHTSNEVLLSGIIQDGDFFVWMDETDKLNPVFLKRIREDVFYWNKNGVGMVYLDHPFILRYHDGLRFSQSPHWHIINTLGKTVELQKIPGYRKENFVFNTRNLLKSAFLNPAKYYFCYPNFSNHTVLLYAHFGQEIYQKHEQLRIQFRYFCKNELGLEWTLDSLINYLKNNVGNYPRFLEEMIEIEPNLKDLFRLYVLKQDLQELIENRFNFSYFIWKESGKLDQKKDDGFIGLYNKYNMSIGRSVE